MEAALTPRTKALFTDQTLVIASHNAGKIVEIGELIAPFGLRALSAADVQVDEPEETGATFAENALLKARHTLAVSGFAALSDDSGLSVAALDGAPGIYSARWAGPGKDFGVAFERVRRELGDKPKDAYFVCALALCLPDGSEHVFEGRIDGQLTFPPRGAHGFGYDPIFVPNGYRETFAEISKEEKNRISHRARAFAKLVAFLRGSA